MTSEDVTPRGPQPARPDPPPDYPPPYQLDPQKQPQRGVENRRLRRALLAAAGVGMLAVGTVGGFGLARVTGAPVAAVASAPAGASSGGGQGGSGIDGIPSGQGSRTAPETATTVGSITAVDGSTLTLQTVQGPSVTVTTSGSTRVRASAGDDISALAVGDVVMVRGDPNANGSLVATAIIQGQLADGSSTSGTAPVTGT